MIQLIHPPLLINVAHPRLHAFTPCPGKNWVIQYRYFRLRWPGKARVNMNPRYLHCTCTSCHDHLNILLWMVMINTKHLLMIKCTIGGIGGMFWFKTQQEQKKNIVILHSCTCNVYFLYPTIVLSVKNSPRIFSSINNKCFILMPIIYFASELVSVSGCWTGLDIIKRKLVLVWFFC